MAGIISALSAATNIVTAVNSSDQSTARAALDALQSKEFALLQTDGSITKLLSKFIVEPVAIVSNELKHEEVIEKVLDTTVDVFASFYLQAFEVLRSVYDLDSQVVIDSLATDNGGLGRVILRGADAAVGREELRDYLGELLSTEDISLSLEANRNSRVNKKDGKEVETSAVIMKELEITLAARRATGGKTAMKNSHSANSGTNSSMSGTVDEVIPSNNSVKNSSAGKSSGKSSAQEQLEETIYTTEYIVIPIIIKTNVIFTDFDNILTMLKPSAHDKTFGYRLDEYRAGAISLTDLIFTSDLIKEYKKNKLKDKEGLIKLLNDRTLSANSKLATNKIVGYEKYYNMVFITAEEKIMLNKHLSGDVMKDKYKERFMEEAKALILVIMDMDYERMIMLTKDLRGKSDTTFKAISKRKENSADYGEIIKSVMANKPVVF